MKILLADPPLVHYRLETNYPNLGLLYLVSNTRQQLEDVDFAYTPARDDLETHLAEIAEFGPDLYGLSFTSVGTENAYTTIRAVRERFPELPILCGGAHPTVMPGEVLEQTPTDLCALGEGEATLVEVIRHLRGEMDRSQVDGLAWLEDGQLVTSPPRTPEHDLDRLSFPAWDLVEPGQYLGPQIHQGEPVTAVLASRGCPYRCTFCSNPVWKLSKPHCRYRSPENLAAEIKMLHDAGYRELYIRSDELNADAAWAEKACRAIADLGLSDMSYQVNLRADRMTDTLADGLAEINCWLVHLGIESGNDRVLKGIRKHITTAQVEDICRALKARGIKVFGFMMMFQAWEENGELEYESVDEVRNSLRFTWRMVRRGLLDYISWQYATPIPGADLWHVARKYDLVPREAKIRNMWEMHLNLPGLDEKVLKRMKLKGMLLQSYLYLKSGRIQWRHWRKILEKLKNMAKSIG